jgi:RimJ/RimL family protein N-acetyltransferase
MNLSPSALELMQFHVQALYIHNEQGRIIAINQWDGGSVPRFFLGRTTAGNVWRFRADLPEHLVNELTALCLEETGAGLLSPKHKDKYIQLLSAQEEVKQLWQGPVYWCSRAAMPAVQPIAIKEANAYFLEGGLEPWLPDVPHRQPFMAAIEDGQAVAVCASVRITPKAHEAGVETLPAYRQRGHAASAVAGWTQTLLKNKIIPLYSTSWENTASQNVAKKVGFEFFGTDFHIT